MHTTADNLTDKVICNGQIIDYIEGEDYLIIKMIATRVRENIPTVNGNTLNLTQDILKQIVNNYNQDVIHEAEEVYKDKTRIARGFHLIKRIFSQKSHADYWVHQTMLGRVQKQHKEGVKGNVLGLMKVVDYKGTPAIELVAVITDKDLIQEVLKGTAYEASIGFGIYTDENDNDYYMFHEISLVDKAEVEGSGLIDVGNHLITLNKKNLEELPPNLNQINQLDKILIELDEVKLTKNKLLIAQKILNKQKNNKNIAQSIIKGGKILKKHEHVVLGILNKFSNSNDKNLGLALLDLTKPQVNKNKDYVKLIQNTASLMDTGAIKDIIELQKKSLHDTIQEVKQMNIKEHTLDTFTEAFQANVQKKIQDNVALSTSGLFQQVTDKGLSTMEHHVNSDSHNAEFYAELDACTRSGDHAKLAECWAKHRGIELESGMDANQAQMNKDDLKPTEEPVSLSDDLKSKEKTELSDEEIEAELCKLEAKEEELFAELSKIRAAKSTHKKGK